MIASHTSIITAMWYWCHPPKVESEGNFGGSTSPAGLATAWNGTDAARQGPSECSKRPDGARTPGSCAASSASGAPTWHPAFSAESQDQAQVPVRSTADSCSGVQKLTLRRAASQREQAVLAEYSHPSRSSGMRRSLSRTPLEVAIYLAHHGAKDLSQPKGRFCSRPIQKARAAPSGTIVTSSPLDPLTQTALLDAVYSARA